ncbi:MAG: hypothetical protein A4E32_02173 [Methanomassiliicoccales archaeon PtaU1.Bin124]|nr:MAG: hypothetical protein A4E32_02173 [Methanomassiliicoccales archaeon PtaU1.Bin124]
MRTGKNRTVDKARLHRIMNVLVERKLVKKRGKNFYLDKIERLPLSTDLSRAILTANEVDNGKADDDENVKIIYPVSWGISYTDTFRADVVKCTRELSGKWAIAAINEIQRRAREDIINVKVSKMPVQEKVYNMMKLHERLDEELVQLGWVIEEEIIGPDQEHQDHVRLSDGPYLGKVRRLGPNKLNECFLDELGILKPMKELYNNNGLGLVIEDKELAKEIRKVNKGKNGIKKISQESDSMVSERVSMILKPLMSMNEPIIISTVALPCYRLHQVDATR